MIARTRLALTILACIATIASAASAQDSSASQAQSLFERGRESMKNGQLQDALRDLTESHALDPKPGTLLNMSLCEEKLGRLIKAGLHLREFLGWTALDDDRRELASRHLRDIEQRMPHVTLRLDKKSASGTMVQIDGAKVDSGTLDVPLPLDPGEHILLLTRTDGMERRTAFQIKERQDLLQIVEWIDAPDTRGLSASSTTTQPNSTNARQASVDATEGHGGTARIAGIVLATIGVAAAIGTAVSAFEVLKDKREVEQHCDARGCDADALEAASAGKTWSAVGTATGITAMVGMGAGAYFLFFASSKSKAGMSPTSSRLLGLQLRATGPIFTVAGTF